MDKSRIFIASSGRTLALAEKLRDELQTDFCEATLWSEEGRSQIGATIIEMLEKAAERFDFAVIILARDDVVAREGSSASTRKARDNCVFEAGLFMATIGRKRCFLVNSVEPNDLPSDLGGIISLHFEEPANLSDRDACAQAIKSVSAALKDNVQRAERSVAHERLPILSIEDVFLRERPQSDGGDLREGQVVVCDLQPNPGSDVALQVRRNLEHGVSYLYFLYFCDDTLDKVLQSIQLLAAGSAAGGTPSAEFNARLETIRSDKGRVLEDLRKICRTRSLLVSFLPTEPQFCFRVHNASDPELARLYLRFRGGGFMLWGEQTAAVSVWRALRHYMPGDDQDRIFVPMKFFDLAGEELRRFERLLNRGLARYFPGIEKEVREILVGPDRAAR